MKRILIIVLSFFICSSLRAQIFLPAMQAVQYRSGVSITTNPITANTTGNSVTSGATIQSSNATVTARGLCWSTTPTPTISNNKSTNGAGAGSFSYNITGLNPGTTYYIRGYATTASGTTYGNEQTVTTLPLINFAYTGSTQTFIVPAGVTSITIEAYGAQGGTAPGPSSNNVKGGNGAYMKGTFAVNPSDVLTILVGGQGEPYSNCGGGGGGGSWVVKGGSTPLLVAGGGGGAFCSNSTSNTKFVEGGPGEITQNGGPGIPAPGAVSTVTGGGTGGNGGYSYFGSGGGGWLTDGTSGNFPTTVGKKYPGAKADGGGGYGGGGGATLVCNGAGGGGGGYSGGGSSAQNGSYNSGGGGGSYIDGTLLASTRGGASDGGNGKVVVRW